MTSGRHRCDGLAPFSPAKVMNFGKSAKFWLHNFDILNIIHTFAEKKENIYFYNSQTKRYENVILDDGRLTGKYIRQGADQRTDFV